MDTTIETMYLTGTIDLPSPDLVVFVFVGIVLCLIFSYIIDRK